MSVSWDMVWEGKALDQGAGAEEFKTGCLVTHHYQSWLDQGSSVRILHQSVNHFHHWVCRLVQLTFFSLQDLLAGGCSVLLLAWCTLLISSWPGTLRSTGWKWKYFLKQLCLKVGSFPGQMLSESRRIDWRRASCQLGQVCVSWCCHAGLGYLWIVAPQDHTLESWVP